MDKISKLAYDLDFNSHKMSFETVKKKLEELILILTEVNSTDHNVSKLKYLYSTLTKGNYKDIF